MLPEYLLKMSQQELQILVGALHEAPYKLVVQLLNKLQSQVAEQEQAKAGEVE